MKISEAELLEWNRLGLVPGPEEGEDAFVERVRNCLNLKETLELDSSFLKNKTTEILHKPMEVAKGAFGIEPTWVPLVFGNKELLPWHGGCAWIFQMQEDGPLGAFIQLRMPFLNSQNYLGFYNRDEILAHELAHIGRMAFNDPAFEEIIAYQSSNKTFTKWLGPIVESPTESVIFSLSLVMVLLVEGYLLFNGEFSHVGVFVGLLALPIAMVLYGLWRLWKKHRQFNRCQKILHVVLNNSQKAQNVLFRLTDEEIREFGKMSPEEIKSYARRESTSSLRWRLLNSAYFHDNSL